LASLDTWDPELSRLLDAAKNDLPKYVGSTGEAWALLADFKAGRVDIKTLSERLIVTCEKAGNDDRERRAMAALVKRLKVAAGKRPEARRLATVLKNLGA
jgi:hypothetical protein